VLDGAGYVAEMGREVGISDWVFDIDGTGNKLACYVDVDGSAGMLDWKVGVNVDGPDGMLVLAVDVDALGGVLD